MHTMSEMTAAIRTRSAVRITNRSGHAKGMTGIAMGYNPSYHSVKVGFLNADGSYSGEYTKIGFDCIEIIADDTTDTEDATAPAGPMHTHCLTCGRALRSDKSRRIGQGPTCAARIRRAARLLDTYKTAQIDAALELIEDGGIIPVRPGRVWATVSTDGTAIHRTAPNACTCPAGLRGTPCYHRAAVALLTR